MDPPSRPIEPLACWLELSVGTLRSFHGGKAMTSPVDPSEPPFPRGVSQPAVRALASIGIAEWRHTSGFRAADLLQLHGFGPKSIRVLNERLLGAGLQPISEDGD